MNWHCIGQVIGLNPLKRVKFISIHRRNKKNEKKRISRCLNPLKRVKFISITALQTLIL